MDDNCCGNFVCEVGESSCSDCGPYSLDSGFCSSGCYDLTNSMFSVEASNVSNIVYIILPRMQMQLTVYCYYSRMF